jgi:hypothetical protein
VRITNVCEVNSDSLFFCSLNYNKFGIQVLHTVRLQHYVHLGFFSKLFKITKINFDFLEKKTTSMELELHLRFL